MPLKPSYLALVGAGGIVAVAGVKGWGVSATLRDIISGQSPTGESQVNPITGANNGSSLTAANTGGQTGSVLANFALSHVGFPYRWGGAPARGASDCSGFCNYIIGTLAGRAIPGYGPGTYNGGSHGPATIQSLAWNGCQRVKGIQNARPGDLAVWQTHMGIIVQAGKSTESVMMVSDLNTSLGTRETTVAGGGPPGEILFVERLKA